jgi:hypothetical protein
MTILDPSPQRGRTSDRGSPASGARLTPPAAAEFIEEPARSTPVLRRTDVLVVGGGPAGTAAALAAARAGVDVTLVERYGCLGGQSTGGLAANIDPMTDWQGRLVVRGIGEELLALLPADARRGPPPTLWGSRDAADVADWAPAGAAPHGVVAHAPCVNPESLKWASQRLLREAGVTAVLHTWAVAPLMGGDAVRGALLENKEGRLAIRARVVVDASGDGDLFARAGAAYETNADADEPAASVGWLFAGVDRARWMQASRGSQALVATLRGQAREEGLALEWPRPAWRDDVAWFVLPQRGRLWPLDAEDQSELEWEMRAAMHAHLDFMRRHAPGFEHAWPMASASQLAVRHSRRLVGVATLDGGHASGVTTSPRADTIGHLPSASPDLPTLAVPYGCLVPARLDGLLAPGRHLSCERGAHAVSGGIAAGWVTGQAAGLAAALAVGARCEPRAVDIAGLQSALRAQGAGLL